MMDSAGTEAHAKLPRFLTLAALGLLIANCGADPAG
jgi:hypothetical protein